MADGVYEDFREWVEHTKDHPDVDHLCIRGGRQGAGKANEAGKMSLYHNCFV